MFIVRDSKRLVGTGFKRFLLQVPFHVLSNLANKFTYLKKTRALFADRPGFDNLKIGNDATDIANGLIAIAGMNPNRYLARNKKTRVGKQVGTEFA